MGVAQKHKKSAGRLPHKPKLTITFDEDARKDYLTGFSKRKNERKAKAQLQLDEKAKEEKRERRAEIRERVKQLRELNENAGITVSVEESSKAVAELEEDEVQYSDGELVTTVITTTEVVPLSFDDAVEEDAQDEDDVDQLKIDSEKRQKVHEAMLALKQLKKQPMPAAAKAMSVKNRKAAGRGQHRGGNYQPPGRGGKNRRGAAEEDSSKGSKNSKGSRSTRGKKRGGKHR